MAPGPKAKMSLGKHLIGDPPWRSLPQGVAVYSMVDPEDHKRYYWEEWELLGYDHTDFWVELDHDDNTVTLYQPVEVDPAPHPEQLMLGQEVRIHVAGKRRNYQVTEVGAATLESVRGGFTYDIQAGQTMYYAELTGSDGKVLSIEKYNEVWHDVYAGRVLSRREQKAHFGKVIAPGGGRLLAWFVMPIAGMAAVLGMAASCSSSGSSTYCTPRSAVQPVTTDKIVSQDDKQICYRRTVYGGGGGRLGGGGGGGLGK